MHIVCPICSDHVNQAENIYVTKCGHVFHYHCLTQWIERSKSCPQCRNKVTERCMFRLYPTVSSEPQGEDAVTLQRRLDDVLLQLKSLNANLKETTTKLEQAESELVIRKNLLEASESKLQVRETAISGLKEQIRYLKEQNKETQRLREENESLEKNIQTMQGLQKVLNATSEEVEEMLEVYSDVRTVATFATALKRALCESERKKDEIRDKLQYATVVASSLKKVAADNAAEMKAQRLSSEEKIASLERMLEFASTKVPPKYKSTLLDCLKLSPKRKADILGATDDGDCSEISIVEDSPSAKKMRPCLDEAILTDSRENSFNTQVTRIENAESPYLRLQQSSLALSALTRCDRVRATNKPLPDKTLKPSEYALLNASKKPDSNQSAKTSIFQKKEPTKIKFSQENNPDHAVPSVSYDGLGGHSKVDVFPVPSSERRLIRAPQTRLPKLSAKHKLKRPTAPTGSQDIGKMLVKIKEDPKDVIMID